MVLWSVVSPQNIQSQSESLTKELRQQGGNLHLASQGQLNQEKEIIKLRELLQEKEKTIKSVSEWCDVIVDIDIDIDIDIDMLAL